MEELALPALVPLPIPQGVTWNARVNAARRMATDGCEPKHLALELPTWNAATTLAREVLVRAESEDESREPLPFHPELETARVQQLARAILAYDPFPDRPEADESHHPVQTLSLAALAEHLGTATQGGLDALSDIALPAASRDDRLRALLLDPAKSTELEFEAGHKLRHVRQLSLEGIQLVALPADLSRMKSLTSLQVGRNRLLAVDDGICSLKQLTRVGLSHNYIRSLPSSIGQLKGLATLHLHCNRLAKLPLSLQDIDGLEELTLYGNELKVEALPISRRATLKALSLCDNKLSAMPELVDPAATLELAEVRLDRNELTAFPKMSLLGHVTQLCLTSNQLYAMPPEIGKLVQLIVLALDDNQLTAVPPTIGQLTDLRELGLSGNVLESSSLPPEISQLARLSELRLDDNRLTSLPNAISALSKLSHLTVARNELASLPQGIGAMKNLRALELSHNRLKELPDGIASLKKLARLGLAHNNVVELPEAIVRCKRLISLSVHDNQLLALPRNLPPKLTELRFHNNPVAVEFSTAEIRALFSAVALDEGPRNVTKKGLASFISELTAEESAASSFVTEVTGDQISVVIHDHGRLGLSFGADGATWPVVDSIAADGLLAHHPELTAAMPLRVVGVTSHNVGTQDMSKLSFAEATRALQTAGLPMTLRFATAKTPKTAAADLSASKQASATSTSLRASARGRRRSQISPRYSHSPRRRSPRELLPETDETIALKKKLKMTATNELFSQLSNDSSVEFSDVRDVLRDPVSAVNSEMSRWLSLCPDHDLSQPDGKTSPTRPSTQHYFTQDAPAVRSLESPGRLRASAAWHMDADQQRLKTRPGSGAISRFLPQSVGYQNSMIQASKRGIPGATKYGISNFVVVPSCTVRELLLMLPGGSSLFDSMEQSDLDQPVLQNTAQAIRVAHAYELSTDPSSTHPEDLAASSVILQSSTAGKRSLVMSSSRGVMRSRWTRWSGFEPSEQVLNLLTKVSRSELITGLTQARIESLMDNSQCAVSAAWLFEFASSERFSRKMTQLKSLTVEDLTVVQGPVRVLADDGRDFEEHSWVAQVRLLGGRLTWANVPATSTGTAPTRQDLLQQWFKGGDVPYIESTRCVWEQLVDPLLFGSEGDSQIPVSSHKRSICELLFRNNPNAVRHGEIGQANVFVSYSAGNRWSVLVGAVREYCDANKLHPSEVFCWLDELSLVFRADMDQKAYHKIYAKIIKECGHTLAVMCPTQGSSPYAHPQWLSRAWCIAEGYETVASGLRLSVGLTEEDTAKVRDSLRSRELRLPFLKAMTTAKIHRAKVFANKDLVSALVKAVGAKTIDCAVSKSLRDWCTELFDRDIELQHKLVRYKRDMKSLAEAQVKLCDFLALPGITSCEQLDLPVEGVGGASDSMQQLRRLESAILKGLEYSTSESLVRVFDVVVNGCHNDAVELLSDLSTKASGTAARARRKKKKPSGFVEDLEDLQESTEQWKDKGKAWQNARKQAERDAAREEDVELKRLLHLVTVMAVEIDLQCTRLSSVIHELIQTTEAAELTILMFMNERDRDAGQKQRLVALSAAADTPGVVSNEWHRSESFRRHKQHGGAEELGRLLEHQEAERDALDKAQTQARLNLSTPMRPDQREDAKAVLAALERDEPWLDDGTVAGRRWESEEKMESVAEAVAKSLGEVTAAAAKELALADKMLNDTKKKLHSESGLKTDIVEDCKTLAVNEGV